MVSRLAVGNPILRPSAKPCVTQPVMVYGRSRNRLALLTSPSFSRRRIALELTCLPNCSAKEEASEEDSSKEEATSEEALETSEEALGALGEALKASEEASTCGSERASTEASGEGAFETPEEDATGASEE